LLGQQPRVAVVVALCAGFLGGFGDRHPQLPLGHRRDQVRVLDRAGQGRIVRAPGLNVSAHPQHDQGRGWLTRAVPGGGGCVQRGDERPPRRLVGALGEQLLELVHHQQQSPRWLIPLRRGAVPIPGWPGWPSQGGLAVGECEPGRRRTAAAPAPAGGPPRGAGPPSGAGGGVTPARGPHAAPGASDSPAHRIRGSTPARSSDDFPAPETPDTTSRPTPASSRDIRSSTSMVAASRPKNNAASRSSNTASPRYGDAVTAPSCWGPAPSAAPSPAAPRPLPRAPAPT